MWHGDFAAELEKDFRKIGRQRQARAGEMPGGAGGLEHLLQPKGRANFDVSMGNLRSQIAEPVSMSSLYGDRLARTRDHRSAADSKFDLPVDDGEPLHLLRVYVTGGHMASRRQEQIEREELTAGLGTAFPNNDALAADRIDDDPTGVRHVERITQQQPGPFARESDRSSPSGPMNYG